MKQKTNFSVLNNLGLRVVPDLIIGKYNGYRSGDILDANQTLDIIKQVTAKIIANAPENMDDLEEIANAIQVIDGKVEYVTEFTDPNNYTSDDDINKLFNNQQN